MYSCRDRININPLRNLLLLNCLAVDKEKGRLLLPGYKNNTYFLLASIECLKDGVKFCIKGVCNLAWYIKSNDAVAKKQAAQIIELSASSSW